MSIDTRRKPEMLPRTVSVLAPAAGIDPLWVGIKRVIRVERVGTRVQRPFTETMFYISSLSLDAAGFAQRIRQHWHIENRLHWVKSIGSKMLSSKKTPRPCVMAMP